MDLPKKFSRYFILFLSAMSFAGLFSEVSMASDRGEQLYRLCFACHGDKGEGNKALAAPSIAGLPLWYLEKQLMGFRKGVRGLHASDEPGMRMRPMARTLPNDDDVKAVAEYVAKMPPVDNPLMLKGSPVRGMEAYAVCSACHQPNGKGNQALGAPPLIHLDDWYMLTQLKNFKNKIRGADPTIDPMGATMAPMAATLDEQGMKDIISYVKKLR